MEDMSGGREMFKPKILTVLKDYSKEQFMRDLLAALIVTVLAISLSIAFAVSMNVPPQVGLYVSIIASFIIALFGGTYVLIAGPSAVFIVAVAGMMANPDIGYGGVMVATFLAGIILILLGILRMGSIIKYLSYPITIGFMSGMAFVIFTSQIRGFLGYQFSSPSNIAHRWFKYIRSLPESDPMTVAVGALCLAILIFWPKVTKKIPGGLVALIVTTAVVHIFHLPVATIGTEYSGLELSFPTIQLPALTFESVTTLLPQAFTIAFICIISSLLTAVASDNLIGKKHDSNMELVAQGISNMLMGLLGYIPSAGVPSRTMANIESGARTPVAGLLHAIFLLLSLIFLFPMMQLIPMVTLAAMLMMAAYGLCEWRVFAKLLRAPIGDVIVLLATFFLSITVELSLAIMIGVLLSILVFLKRMGDQMSVTDDYELVGSIPEEISIFDVEGPLFFGDTDKFLDSIHLSDQTKAVIVRLRRVGMMDVSALRAIDILQDKCKRKNVTLILSETPDGPYHLMKKMGVIKQLGKANVRRELEDAIAVAKLNL